MANADRRLVQEVARLVATLRMSTTKRSTPSMTTQLARHGSTAVQLLWTDGRRNRDRLSVRFAMTTSHRWVPHEIVQS